MAEMKLTVVLLVSLLCLIVPLTQAEDIDFTNCGGGTEVEFLSVSVSPYPLVIGKTSNLTITGNIAQAITGGWLSISLIYDSTEYLILEIDLCEASTCPIPAGPFNLTSLEHPQGIPPDLYHFKISINDEEHDVLACILFRLEVAAASWRIFRAAYSLVV